MDPVTKAMPVEILAEFPSDSDPRKTYQVRLGKDGVVYCTCWAWLRSPKGNKDCKHLKRIRESLTGGDRSLFRQSFRKE